MTRSRQQGFTVLELIIVVIFLLVIGTIFFVQKRDLEIAKRDTQRKTAINAIYYNLEDIYHPASKAYPEKLTADQLPGLDPAQLKDPDGVTIGDQNSEYRYEPKNCKDGTCKSYQLRVDLEKEADYIKDSRNK